MKLNLLNPRIVNLSNILRTENNKRDKEKEYKIDIYVLIYTPNCLMM